MVKDFYQTSGLCRKDSIANLTTEIGSQYKIINIISREYTRNFIQNKKINKNKNINILNTNMITFNGCFQTTFNPCLILTQSR